MIEKTLEGFAAISANNGWLMALIGISIVMVGLSVLSIVITLFPLLVSNIEKKKTGPEERKPRKRGTAEDAKSEIPNYFPSEPKALAELYTLLTRDIGSEFKLQQLYAEAAKQNYPHPHISIRQLREDGMLKIVEEGGDLFRWAS